MAQAQCRLQFTDNCRSRETLASNCPDSPVLQISCDNNATSAEIQQMAMAFTGRPLRPVWISLVDGDQVTFDNFAPVRQQVLLFTLSNCTSVRSTGRLSSLLLSNLLDLYVENCYNLKIRRADFWPSPKLRLITFANTTIQSLERFTFTDLPALRLLSLEAGLAQMQTFSSEIRAFLKELHCGLAFEWFREWWENKHLMTSAGDREVYQIYPFHWGNDAINNSQVYLPVDCAVKPFPTGAGSIDFQQQRFSINDNLYKEKWQPGDPKDSGSDDRYPEFSVASMSPEECATQNFAGCNDPGDCRTNDTRRAYQVSDYCGADLNRIRRVVTAISRLPLRAVLLDLDDSTVVEFKDFAPIRQQIVLFNFMSCVKERAMQKLHDLYLTNLIQLVTCNCSDLVITRSDFQNSVKLRQIFFYNTTIRALEENAFSNLPSLVGLSLEYNLQNLRTYEEELADPQLPVMFTQRIRDYLLHLHCGCEFAWFRRWWSNNTSRFTQIADTDGAYQIFSALNSFSGYGKYQIPIDCSKPIPMGAEFINVNQSEYSINAVEC
ncbi:uncharacterized protein LOC129582214 isoform X2 [Paramacrobiotus metropolitanus]|nr:uncharacterized protein LOC129582214 isoform X2 [Paramacrobiotus metropolitanus]